MAAVVSGVSSFHSLVVLKLSALCASAIAAVLGAAGRGHSSAEDPVRLKVR